jgi:hypothetical protein
MCDMRYWSEVDPVVFQPMLFFKGIPLKVPCIPPNNTARTRNSNIFEVYSFFRKTERALCYFVTYTLLQWCDDAQGRSEHGGTCGLRRRSSSPQNKPKLRLSH